MADRPILFSAPMVHALLDGRKTQTRRVLKPAPFIDGMGNFCAPDRKGTIWNYGQGISGEPWTKNYIEKCVHFAVGDRLYVREAHYLTDNGHEEFAVYAADQHAVTEHLATVDALPADFPANLKAKHRRLRPGIHMPRWASRLTLLVTDVRIERLQDCSEVDAIAEGVAEYPCEGDWRGPNKTYWTAQRGADISRLDPVAAYQALWDSINGPGAWEANPWIVAITFTVEHRNIDHG